MNKLRNILIAGSFLLASCNNTEKNSSRLTEEHFNDAEWVCVPYKGEIWNSYMGEDVVRYERNWEKYQIMVAQKNGFTYLERNGKRYITGFDRRTILLPNLDSNMYVISGRDISTMTRVNELNNAR